MYVSTLFNEDLTTLNYIAYLLHDNLAWLEVSQCPNISDAGLLSLKKMNALKVLHLEKLPAVKNPQNVIAILEESLPKCHIEFPPYTDEKNEEID